jgi:uncharacterized protein YoxC
METLLMVAIVLIALAVVAQAGVLIAMYIMSRRIGSKAEALMEDSRKLIAPLESITSNLKTVSEDLTEAGRMAREQVLETQEFINETQAKVREDISEIRELVLHSVDQARATIMRPIRQYAAVAQGIAVGVRTFFSRKPRSEETMERDILAENDRNFPAA